MSKKDKKVTKTSIGGQAVLEGVMMRGKTAMATAVRDAEGKIRMETKRVTPPEKQPWILRAPIIRGVVNFINSMVGGSKTLMRSAEVYGEEEEPSKFEKWLAEKLHVDLMGVVTTIALILGLGLSVLLFVMLPQWVSNGISALTGIESTSFWYNLIEGLVRIFIFVCYILLTSLMKDIRRTYMYHGAEHKTITCYEKGLELTPENARTCTRVHNRCGTTFLFFVMLVSILVFSVANTFLAVQGVWRMLLKIALLPLVAGLSYELLKALAKTDSWILFPLKAPGLALQRITTREPDDGMLEVAIAAFKKVLEMDADPTIPEEQFVTALKANVLLEQVNKILAPANVDESDGEWIVSILSGVPRSDLAKSTQLCQPSVVERAFDWAKQRLEGAPLWYITGDAEFYGYTFKVDSRVLIPRPETEELCEYALSLIKDGDSVLDLCTGSGAIAVTLAKKSSATVYASDISEGALELASQNAELNQASVQFIHSNLFENIEGKFNLIVSNPPYIPTADVQQLDKEVKDYEPILALDGGVDGLDFYRLIAKNASEYLEDGGLLLMEFGIGQAQDIANLLEESFTEIEIKKDISGKERIIKARKR
ncbi:MAG: peptide chain release factor N(5)-glutamine methyltransferase [Clostridiales bacterium]|nr:peptide chain release factor N(5)-glutamine methyltransferase [Clostridiales bacterium]